MATENHKEHTVVLRYPVPIEAQQGGFFHPKMKSSSHLESTSVGALYSRWESQSCNVTYSSPQERK